VELSSAEEEIVVVRFEASSLAGSVERARPYRDQGRMGS